MHDVAAAIISMNATSIGPGISQSESVGENLFKLAEKLYARKLVQRMKQRNGKMHGGKMVLEPTDVSKVLDLHASLPPSCCTHPSPLPPNVSMHSINLKLDDQTYAAELQQPPLRNQPSAPSPSPATSYAFTFTRHPGLIVIPAALPPPLQASLALSALTEYPEPPANTNHTAKYGHLPPHLFNAALLGKVLRKTAVADAVNLNHDNASHLETASVDTGYKAYVEPSVDEDEDGTGEGDNEKEISLSPSRHSRPMRRTAVLQDAPPSAIPGYQWALPQGNQDSQTITARHLLLKLRWATLGPQFDWTQRSYDLDTAFTDPNSPQPSAVAVAAAAAAGDAYGFSPVGEPSSSSTVGSNVGKIRPLPLKLKEIAVRIAESIKHLWSLYYPNQDSDPIVGQAELDNDQARSTVHQRNLSRKVPRKFDPNAAIVNYYREGDTLGGHLDDVEPDMDQPIVGISLGCDGIFIMGGSWRDYEPTAVVLRGGDVVILAGEARRCYHGVPRVMERFEDLKSCDGKGVKVNKRSLSSSTYLGASIENDGDSSGNSKEGGDKADGEGNELRLIRGAIGAHLRGTRINISIRDVS